MNVNVHSQPTTWNLGLIRAVGSCPADKCISLLLDKLAQFDLDLEKDIVVFTTDGASVMKKVCMNTFSYN